jgi:hypothetical protein
LATWTVTATLGTESASDTVNVTANQNYNITLSYSVVVGVEWDYSNPSTQLRRLTRANDPNGFVTNDITAEPVAAVGTGAGSSQFNSLYPWSEMDEFNIINNLVSHRRGSANFSRTANDTVVRVPKYWFRIEQIAASTRIRFYISSAPRTGFTLHPAFARGDGAGERDFNYVGKYNTGAGYVSRSGLAPLVSITRATARTGSAGKGAPWWQYDYAAWCAVWLLYLVEFADWDSQARIGAGITGSVGANVNSGGTDAMNYHTGRAAGTNDQVAVQYRGIENPWGNVREWIDGININNQVMWTCLRPSLFADDVDGPNYQNTGATIAGSGWIRGLTVTAQAPWAFIPTLIGGSGSTFIPDYLYATSGRCVLLVGGVRHDTTFAGLFYFGAGWTSSNTITTIGTRLLFLP